VPDLNLIEQAVSMLVAHLRMICASTFTNGCDAIGAICGLHDAREWWNCV